MGTLRAVLAVLLLSCPALAAAGGADDARARAAVARVDVPFVENLGQADPEIRFFARTLGGALLVSRSGELALSLPAGGASRERVVLREALRGGKVREVRGLEPSAARVSFFTGRDPSRWRSGVPTWDTVTLGEVWPGVELRLRAQAGTVEKIFHVRPGGRPGAIQVDVRGARRLSVEPDGRLAADTGRGVVHFSRPVAWQEGPAGRVPVEVAYRVSGRRYAFAVGAFDRTRELVVDPFVSTYLGGTGAEEGYGIDVLKDGNGAAVAVFVAGRTNSLSGWPAAKKPTGGGDGGGATDAFVARLAPGLLGGASGSLTVAYLGGTGDDAARDVAVFLVDHDGNPETARVPRIFVTGSTTSPDFPMASAQSRGGAQDAFVARFSDDLGTLEGSRYLGGSASDNGESIAVGEGGVYVAGTTGSPTFPGTAGAPYTSGKGFVARLSLDVQSVVAATFADASHGIALRSDGVVYVAGEGLRTVTNPVPPPDTVTSYDPFVLALDAGLRTVVGRTYVGGAGGGVELGAAVAIDPLDLSVYLVGTTTCDPVTRANEYQDPPNTCTGLQEGFVTRFDQGLAPACALFLGGAGMDRALDVQVLGSGEAVVLGYTDRGISQMTAGGILPAPRGARDLFLARAALLRPPGESCPSDVVQATYLGGSGTDEAGHGLAAVGTDVVVAGTTGSTDLPGVSTASAQPSPGGMADAFVASLDATLQGALGAILSVQPAEIDFGNVVPPVTPRPVSIRNVGFADLTVKAVTVDSTVFPLDTAGGDAPCGATPRLLTPGGVCTVTVGFQPTTPGSAAATLRVDAGTTGSAQVALRGRFEPDIRVLPATLAFGPTQVGTSAVATISFENQGAADLHVGAVTISQALGTPAGTFSLTFGGSRPGACPVSSPTLRAGAACTVLATFTPPAAQGETEKPFGATVTVTSDDPDEGEITVPVSGRGVAAPTQPVTVTPEAIDYGAVTAPASQLVWVLNQGAAPVTLSYGVTSVDPLQAAQFRYDADWEPTSAPCDGLLFRGTLPAGQVCGVKVVYDPRQAGTHRAEFHVVTSLVDLPALVVSLSGSASGDADGDGVLDSEEQGPNRDALDPSYDGDGGMADSGQANAASLRSLDGQRYLTITSSNGVLRDVRVAVTPAGAPGSHAYPFGFFRFTVTVPAQGGSTTVTIRPHGTLPTGMPTWMKSVTSTEWYDLAGRTAVSWDGTALSFTLVDGGVGDGDGQANGSIVDPGAPAWPEATPPPSGGGGGGGCGCGASGDALGVLALAWLAVAGRGRRSARRA